MRELLSASLARLWKGKLFWLLEVLFFVFGIFVYVLAAINTHSIGLGWLEHEAHALFYLPIFPITIVIALFSCFFIGNDYSDGTIRNKLIVGHSREIVYLSFFFTELIVAFLFSLSYLLAVLLVGLPLSGITVFTQVEIQPWRLLGYILLITECAALFTLLSMSDTNVARNVVVSLIVAMILILSGRYVYNKISQPKFIPIVSKTDDGGFLLENGDPNPHYLTGILRTFYEWLAIILPYGAASLSLDKTCTFDLRIPVIHITITVFITILGIRIFKKKDIK